MRGLIYLFPFMLFNFHERIYPNLFTLSLRKECPFVIGKTQLVSLVLVPDSVSPLAQVSTLNLSLLNYFFGPLYNRCLEVTLVTWNRNAESTS